MKRHIMLLTMLCACILSCEIESADTPTREKYTTEKYASETTLGRIEFPLAMMETAFNIEAYEKASAEEKVQMAYIFNCLLKEGNSYRMNYFHSFYLTPDEKSIYEAGARWNFSAFDYGYGSKFTLNCIEDGKWEMVVQYDNGQITFNISQLPQEESLFNWEISLAGSLTSGQGRIVDIRSAGPVTRKVCSDQWKCSIVMAGEIIFNIYDNDESSTPQDTFRYAFSGQEEDNAFYQL